ncbi:hypothetical protein SALBM311S_01329 [Streptomyces alboniger]
MLSAVELWRFRDEAADVRVTLDGLDLFRTPKAEVRRWLEEQGIPSFSATSASMPCPTLR